MMVDEYVAYEEAHNTAPNEHATRSTTLGLVSAADIVAMDLPPVRFVVSGYIAEGLTLLAGKPKTGKSYMALGLAVAVASGSRAFGSIPCEQGDVLYLALEDNRRRLQRRLKQMLPHGGIPERLFIDTDCKRLGMGGEDLIRECVDRMEKPRLIVVDVLAKVRPDRRQTESLYDVDYRAMEPLQRIASEWGIAVLALHHTRKMEAEDPFDTVSGSTGLTGAADSVLVLSRDGQGITLYGRGRDIEEIETAMQFDHITGSWSIMGDASEVRRSDERTVILDALKEAPATLGPAKIAAATGLKENNVRRLILKMVEQGQIVKTGYGHYAHPNRTDLMGGGNSGHTGNSWPGD